MLVRKPNSSKKFTRTICFGSVMLWNFNSKIPLFHGSETITRSAILGQRTTSALLPRAIVYACIFTRSSCCGCVYQKCIKMVCNYMKITILSNIFSRMISYKVMHILKTMYVVILFIRNYFYRAVCVLV